MSKAVLTTALNHVGDAQQINSTLQLLIDGFLESSLASCPDNRLAVLELHQELKCLM